MRETPLEMQNGPGASAKKRTGTVNPSDTNQKGSHMSTSQPTGSHRCPPWCDHTMRGLPDETHEQQCVSRDLGRLAAVDNHARRLTLNTSVTHQRDLLTARSRVRILLQPKDGDRAAEALAMSSADARSLASALRAAADVADGLAPIAGDLYGARLHATAAALADQADAAFEAGDEGLAEALDTAALRLRSQAVAL